MYTCTEWNTIIQSTTSVRHLYTYRTDDGLRTESLETDLLPGSEERLSRLNDGVGRSQLDLFDGTLSSSSQDDREGVSTCQHHNHSLIGEAEFCYSWKDLCSISTFTVLYFLSLHITFVNKQVWLVKTISPAPSKRLMHHDKQWCPLMNGS